MDVCIMAMVQLYYNSCKRQVCNILPNKFHNLNVVAIVSNSPASMLAAPPLYAGGNSCTKQTSTAVHCCELNHQFISCLKYVG